MTKAEVKQSEAAEILRDVRQAVVALRDAEEREGRLEKNLGTQRELAARRRLELGRQLVRARALWPRSGPKAKPWGDLLLKLGIEQQRAWEYMELAGYVEREVSPASENDGETSVPTNREVGIDKRPRLALVSDMPAEDTSVADRAVVDLPPPPAKAERDSYCTPKIVTNRLPLVDLDPCSNPRSTVRARTVYSLEAGQNGLVLPWFGIVYANVPFSGPKEWVDKYEAEKRAKHVDGLGWMCNTDHSTEWWQRLVELGLYNRLDFDDRLQFDAGVGVEMSTNDRPQTLLMTDGFFKRCPDNLFDLGIVWRVR